jgi:hypothetical protein
MRRVTANPPAMLMLVINIVAAAIHIIKVFEELICNRAPMTMMLDIALVTLISGVCSAGDTFQITI